MAHKGTLLVRPICAKLTYSTETFGRMDPYCIIVCGTQKHKTRTANDAGKNPSWNDTLTYNVSGQQMLQLTMFDKDTFTKDDFICEGSIPLMDVFHSGKDSKWFPVTRKGKNVGQVRIDMTFDNPTKKKNKGMHGHGQGYPMQHGYPMQPG